MFKSLKLLAQCMTIYPTLILALGGVSTVVLPLSNSASAQTPPATHSKATGIPEKKPDGTWEGLRPEQQKILAPLEADWDYMLPDSRKKWILVSNLYPKMSPADQLRLQSRMMGWSNLSQKDRRLARENYLTSLKFPADKKVEAWSAYQKLSDEQKKKLAQQEMNKKKPTVVNAPTLQQHTIVQKSNLVPTLPSISAPVLEAPSAISVPSTESNASNTSSGTTSNP